MIELMLKLWLQRKQLSWMLSKKINKRRKTVRLLSKENNRRRTARSYCHWTSSLHSLSLWCSSLKINQKIVKILHQLLLLLLLLSMNLHFLLSHSWCLEQSNLIMQWRKQLYESRSFSLNIVFKNLRWR